MNARPVLIVSSEIDAHARNLAAKLKEQDSIHFFFSTTKYPFTTQISYSGDGTFILSDGTNEVVVDENWTIWNRRVFPPEFPEGFPTNLEGMVTDEAKVTMHGMMATHRGLVVNNPLYNAAANNKSEQLQRAREIGLSVPETLITNNPQAVQEFYERLAGDVLFKMQKMPIVECEDGVNRTVLATRVLPEHFEHLKRIQNNPCCFQRYIPKDYEIRATIIGERVFPIAIHSQDSDYSKDDFRRYDFDNVRYNEATLPEDVEKRLVDLAKSYKLHYAAIDLICTPEGEHVFLEVNPNGQYLWTEEYSGVPITDAFVDLLTGKCVV